MLQFADIYHFYDNNNIQVQNSKMFYATFIFIENKGLRVIYWWYYVGVKKKFMESFVKQA